MHQEYVEAIVNLLDKCEDIELLDLVLKLLQKG